MKARASKCQNTPKKLFAVHSISIHCTRLRRDRSQANIGPLRDNRALFGKKTRRIEDENDDEDEGPDFGILGLTLLR
jgi:hypothetical protein